MSKTKEKAKEADDEEVKTGEEGEATEGEGAPKKSKKKLIIIGAAALVLLIGGGVGAFMFLSPKHVDKPAEGAEAVPLDEHGNPITKPTFYTLPEFLVNLSTSGKASQFLKTTVILELAKPSDVALIEGNLPRLVDSINTYLRELRSSDLAGSAGIQRLREEILLRVNKTMAPTKINDVLFKEIVVQ